MHRTPCAGRQIWAPARSAARTLRPWTLKNGPVPWRSCGSNRRSGVNGAWPGLRHDDATCRWTRGDRSNRGCGRYGSCRSLRCCHGCSRLRLCGDCRSCGDSWSCRNRCRSQRSLLCRWSSGSCHWLRGKHNWRRNRSYRSLRRGCGSRRRNHCRTSHNRTSRWPARYRRSSRRRSHNIRLLTRQRNDLARSRSRRGGRGLCRCARGGTHIRYGRGSLLYRSGRRRGGRWNHRWPCDYRRRGPCRSLGLFTLENRLQGVTWFGDLRQIKFRLVRRLPRGPTRATTT
jgi:hypothetical protein